MVSRDRTLVDGYLQHLTTEDLELVVQGSSKEARSGDPGELIRFRLDHLPELLSRPELFDAVFNPSPDAEVAKVCSPFLVFAVSIARVARELSTATFVVERLAPRVRGPVFDTDTLRDFLSDEWRRLFLAELLASYTHVASGSVLVSTRRGFRRQRFSELDPVQMAGLLDVVSTAERPGIYRRLGDLALFLTGVFPDAVARRGFGPVAEGRLLRAGRVPREGNGRSRRSGEEEALAGTSMGLGDDGAVGLLVQLGRRWYRAAASSVPRPVPANLEVLAELPQRFDQARRVLNLVTERFLFERRSRWFGIQP